MIAVFPEESLSFDESVMAVFREFIGHVFDHVPGKTISVGRLLDRAAAQAEIGLRRDEDLLAIRRSGATSA